jgi:hypothetical protein
VSNHATCHELRQRARAPFPTPRDSRVPPRKTSGGYRMKDDSLTSTGRNLTLVASRVSRRVPIAEVGSRTAIAELQHGVRGTVSAGAERLGKCSVFRSNTSGTLSAQSLLRSLYRWSSIVKSNELRSLNLRSSPGDANVLRHWQRRGLPPFSSSFCFVIDNEPVVHRCAARRFAAAFSIPLPAELPNVRTSVG